MYVSVSFFTPQNVYMRLRMSYVICWARGSKFYTHQVRHKKEAGDMYPQSRYYIHISLKSFVYIGKDGEYTSSRMCTIQK